MRVLIIKTSALGDVVQALEVLGELALFIQEHKIKIDWLVEKPAASLVALHPLVEHLHIIDTKRWRSNWTKPFSRQELTACLKELRRFRYDVVIDLQANTKSAICRLFTRAKKHVGLSKKAVSEWPASLGIDLALTPQPQVGARAIYRSLLNLGMGVNPHDLSQKEISSPLKLDWKWDEKTLEKGSEITGSSAYGIVSMGSRWPNKHMPSHLTESAIQTMRSKRPQDKIYLSYGSESERKMAQAMVDLLKDPKVSLLPSCNLVTLADVIRRACWMISADSLALHLGMWMQTPSFGFFGPSSGEYYTSQLAQHSYWQGGCPYNMRFEKRCDLLRTCPTGACLQSGESTSMLKKLNAWILTLN